jgi:hypothetical protein
MLRHERTQPSIKGILHSILSFQVAKCGDAVYSIYHFFSCIFVLAMEGQGQPRLVFPSPGMSCADLTKDATL